MLPFPFIVADSLKLTTLNEVIGTSRHLPITLQKTVYQLRLVPHLPEYIPLVHFQLSVNQDPLIVGLSTLPPPELLGGSLKEVALSECPAEVKGGLLECWFEDILEAVEKSLHVTTTIVSFDLSPKASTTEHTPIFFELYASDNTVPVLKGHFEFTDSLLARVEAAMKNMPTTEYADFSTIPLKSDLQIGSIALTPMEFRTLEISDVLLTETFFTEPNQSLTLCLEPNLTFNLKYQKPQATIMSMQLKQINRAAYNPKLDFRKADELDALDMDDDEDLDEDEDEDTSSASVGAPISSSMTPTPAAAEPSMPRAPTPPSMVTATGTVSPVPTAPIPPAPAARPPMVPTRPAAAATSAPNSAIDQILIDVTFRVGQKNITFAELKSLKPGYTFELENPLEKPVTIYANGTAIGVGELVQIEKRIGVRILDWGKATA